MYLEPGSLLLILLQSCGGDSHVLSVLCVSGGSVSVAQITCLSDASLLALHTKHYESLQKMRKMGTEQHILCKISNKCLIKLRCSEFKDGMLVFASCFAHWLLGPVSGHFGFVTVS